MMRITLIVPFNGAENKTEFWANEEAQINFRGDHDRAARCTIAFAATELKSYLSGILNEPEIDFKSKKIADNFYIELRLQDNGSGNDEFTFDLQSGGLSIIGRTRAGLLYGAYEFLRLQGVRWYAPGQEGEYSPPVRENLMLPDKSKTFRPAIPLLRGFDFEEVSKESAQLLLWMARNRLNMCGYRPSTAALAQKLGMKFKVGGHMFHSILNPDRRLEDGQTIWDKHQDWYGLPADGQRDKKKAMTTQFCVSNAELRKFLFTELLVLLKNKWAYADYVDVWGFDTWGQSCSCPNCKQIGSSTDQTVFFLSSLRTDLNKAVEEAQLDHNVHLVMCSYEGTATLEAPQRPVPENLVKAKDIVAYYPINRCYTHDMADSSCLCNKTYMSELKSWAKLNPGLSVMVGEYYNVSRFEDLPLLFSDRIKNDLKDYNDIGIGGMTYMHLPMLNWAMRTLTQCLYAQLCWDSQTDAQLFSDEYFANWYGPYGDEMKCAYNQIETAWKPISDWRAWGNHSVLLQLQQWDGSVSAEPLLAKSQISHFSSSEDAIESGRNSVKLLQNALTIIENMQERDRAEAAKCSVMDKEIAVNPVQARRFAESAKYEMRLAEDRRLLIFGLDSLSMLVELTTYHNLLYKREAAAADVCWQKIESIASKLDSYYVPISYEWPGAGLVGKDALTRTQVRELLRRCRKYRLKNYS